MQEKFYTINEITELLQVAKLTVYRYINSGKIKAYKFGKEFRIKKADLDSFLATAKFIPKK